ncbi:MAG: hypothetical protein DWQ31_12280 [Planctomycetota bacterium]|nr:MAG: hypothetical protein DWQ31_12280 [Planctomycetota bacterium]REJ96907.1 MAG: hypothetical protein DWQ35_03260 [Planctomycetota bacterium]REK24591.1 MAG: hypothetical protein DWQ42_13445 [Planctomycetota bacterium]REK45977.1 MAG: hypothetical protein DWQ46_07730 [Planctomycetota bacterium]
MNELDKKIREALAAEDQELAESFADEQSIFQMIGDSFRGRHRWLVALVFVETTVFLVLAILSAVQFFQAETERDMMMWSVAFLLFLLAIMAGKIWYWMELNKNAVTREVKRVELQIAHLAQRLRGLEDAQD